MLHAFAVVMPRFLLVDHVPLMLGEIQEAANGAEILPEGAVFWAGVFLPAKQFTEPSLERRGSCELELPGAERLGRPGLRMDCHPSNHHVFRSELFPPTLVVTEMVQLLNLTGDHADCYAKCSRGFTLLV